MISQPVLRTVRVLSAVLVVVAIVAQAKVLADNNAFDPTRFFAYFTIQSNLIGVAAFVWLVARGDAPRSRATELLRAGAAVYLTITFFVVIFLLSGVDVGLQLGWVDVALHKIFPIVVVLDWILDPPRTRLTVRHIANLIAFPLGWTALTMIRGAVDPARWYPYPFLDPDRIPAGATSAPGYAGVLVTLVIIAIGFAAIAAAIIGLGNWRGDAARDPAAGPTWA